MTMKDSELARKMEDMTDSMIISLMEQLKITDIKGEYCDDSSNSSAMTSSSSPIEQMNEILTFYSDVIEQLWKIAENISKTSEAEEKHAGTVFMGSSGDGTYLPEISDTFDTYVMEEDSQFEMQEDLEAIDSQTSDEKDTSKCLLKVIPTDRAGYFLITWTEYGLQLKRKHEAKQKPPQAEAQDAKDAKPEVAIFDRLVEYTEEIQHEGKTLLVISPSKIRQGYLKNPPTSIQGFPVWFRMQDQNSPAITLLTEELKHNETIRKIMITDLVLGMRTTMPSLNQNWIEEKQASSEWLKNDLLSRLQEDKSFVVAKSWDKDQENLVLWRISYSVVERQCIKFLPREPKICLLILKAIRRKFLSEPKGLVTYHLKTVLFYHLDKNGSDWKTTERAQNIFDMLNALAEALKVRTLPLFFEAGINTLGGMDETTAAELEMKTRQILASPRSVLMSGILFQSFDESHKKENFQKGKEQVYVWFDEKPPKAKLFDGEDFQE